MEKIGYKIKFLHSYFRKQIESNDIIFNSNLSRSEFWVMNIVIHSINKLCLKDIQEMMNITRSTASELLTGLENKGFVKKEAHPTDSRVKYIIVSDLGMNEFEKITDEYKKLDEDFSSLLNKREQETFEYLINKIINQISEKGEEGKNDKICCCKKKIKDE